MFFATLLLVLNVIRSIILVHCQWKIQYWDHKVHCIPSVPFFVPFVIKKPYCIITNPRCFHNHVNLLLLNDVRSFHFLFHDSGRRILALSLPLLTLKAFIIGTLMIAIALVLFGSHTKNSLKFRPIHMSCFLQIQ